MDNLDFFGLNDSSSSDEIDDCESNFSNRKQQDAEFILSEREAKMKADADFDMDLLINSHKLTLDNYGPNPLNSSPKDCHSSSLWIEKKSKEESKERTLVSRNKHPYYLKKPFVNRVKFQNLHSFSDLCDDKNNKHAPTCSQDVLSTKLNHSTSLMTISRARDHHLTSHENKKCKMDENVKSMPEKTSQSQTYEVHSKIKHFLEKSCVKSRLPSMILKKLEGHASSVNKIQWCIPHFSQLLLSASMDRTVKIWDVFKAECLHTLNHSAAVKSAQWSLNGFSILSGGYDCKARIIDVVQGKDVSVYPHEHYVSSVIWHPTEQNLFLTGSFGKLQLWDTRQDDDKPCLNYESNFGQIQDVIFLSGGSQFVCSTDVITRDSADRTIMAWDLKSGAILSNQIFQERYTCPCLALHPSGSSFVAQTQGDYMAEFSAVRPYKMNKNKRFENHKVAGYAVNCDFSKDGEYIASGSSTGEVYFYRYRNANVVSCVKLFSNDACLSVIHHPVLNSTVAVASWTGKIQIWQ